VGGIKHEMVERDRASQKMWSNVAEPSEDWDGFCRKAERSYPETPPLQVWPKKFHRFGGDLQDVVGKVPRRSTQRGVRSGLKASSKVDQELFRGGSDREVEVDFTPLKNPMVIDLQELLEVSAAKRERPRLAARRIQVLGRRMANFVPAVWKSPSEKREQRIKFAIAERLEQRKSLTNLES
jgi:hypothetical protein